ncbi:MAG: hypothetical protein HY815_13680 [Candidatus Riflebacteria bacterium]|nr:hypothetical protein [Candidatus Riflebacteria bacterium]
MLGHRFPAIVVLIVALLFVTASSVRAGGSGYTAEEEVLLAQLRKSPGDAGLMIKLAKALGHRGEWKRALECFDLLLEQRPDHVNYRLARVKCLIRLDRRETALEELEALFKRNPGHPMVVKLLGEMGRKIPGMTEVNDRGLLGRILEREHCLMHQAIVQIGVSRYNTAKGRALYLRPENWRQVVADLGRFGFLPRRVGQEPGGKGELRAEPGGSLCCTVHGSARASGAAACPDPGLPRLAFVKMGPAVRDDVLRSPSGSAVLCLSALAAYLEDSQLAFRLAGCLKAVVDPADLALALEQIGSVPFPADAGRRVAPQGLVALLGHQDPEVRERTLLALLRMGLPCEARAADVINVIRRAVQSEASAAEVAALLARIPAAQRSQLATYGARMPVHEALVAIPGLARLKDRQVLVSLAGRLPDFAGPARQARLLLLAALKEATGEDAGESAVAWREAIEKRIPAR